jgi:protein-disulfide isomerase
MAIASPRVRADIVDVTEFPDLATRYAVQGVPKTILNDRLYFEGALPEPQVMAAVVSAARASSGKDAP